MDPRDSIQDLSEEERLALFRVGRRRRPTEFQLFSGPTHNKFRIIFTLFTSHMMGIFAQSKRNDQSNFNTKL